MKLRRALLASVFASTAFAGSPAAIGVVTASGAFQLEGSRIWGNSTLFEGARVETKDASSELKLSNGVKVLLAAGSAARIWNNRLELERGTGQIAATNSFPVNIAGMTVEGSRFRVGYAGARIEVASLRSDARVIGANHALIGSVPAGRNMSFAMQQAITRVGCLLYKTNGFILQVDDSPEVLQVTGNGLAAAVGNRVEVTGTLSGASATITPASGVLNASTLATRSTGGCLTTAAALSAQTSVPANAPTVAPAKPGAPAPTSQAPVAKSGGMSTGAKVAIIGAIGGGAAGAALALGGGKDSTSP